MNIELIRLFNCALREEPAIDASWLQQEAMKRGYIVHPDICNLSVKEFIEQQTINVNSTFYQTFQDVVSKDRWELFIDQVMHYITTYGTDFSIGNGYVPNAGVDVPMAEYKNYKVILPVTEEELAKRCYDILSSGVALKQTTMTVCADFIASNIPPQDLDIDGIKNREAQVYLCDKLHLTPQDGMALLRYIIFKTTNSTLLIKNKRLIDSIYYSDTPFNFSCLEEKQLHSLAHIFLRFKPLFLAFRKKVQYDNNARNYILINNPSNARIINRIRRLARREHQPMNKSFWQNVISADTNLQEVKNRLHEITLFKVVALMQLCKERLLDEERAETSRLYIIRNQKLYLKPHTATNNQAYKDYLNRLYALLENHLIDELHKKACTVKFPTDFLVALPTTEKSFVGQMPFGTKYKLNRHNYIGIYWRAEWGTRDFDLSIIDESGRKYGWNADYYDAEAEHKIIFSGDMTNAEPEASEVFYFAKGCETGIIYVNRYNGAEGSKYKLYLGQEEIKELKQNYMVDPSSICLQVDMESTTDKQQTVGLIFDDTVTLMEFTMGHGQVSTANAGLLERLKIKTQCFVSAEQILRKAGFREPDNGEVAELDLTQPDRSTLIQLMTRK